MTCAFTLDHYRELLAAVGDGGYRFATFDATPGPGDLLLRHDVDMSLDAVLESRGVVQAETYIVEGETIRPVRLDGDRRGYVIATADTSVEALASAEVAARLVEVEVE